MKTVRAKRILHFEPACTHSNEIKREKEMLGEFFHFRILKLLERLPAGKGRLKTV